MAELQLDTWHYRRRVVFWTMGYCGAVNAWVAVGGTDGALHMTIANGLIYLAGFMGLIYVAGALVEDLVRAKFGLPPRDNPPKDDP